MKEDDSLVYFATKNKGKYAEAKQVASEHGIQLAHLNWDKYEIQDDNISRIASLAAEVASRESEKNSVVAEDAGFFVNALHGFPGPYSSYVYEKLGVHGILKLMQDVTQRHAYFSSAIAYSSRGRASVCFEGIVRGSLCHAPRGSRGFGFDPIFIPTKGDGRTFAEMNIEEKNQLSHRAVAFGKFCTWFTAHHGEK
ncbi:MAG: XTP/dITP diphosphatase [Candidatus Bathyarchaeia archaeon]